jgi:hypothetical protein
MKIIPRDEIYLETNMTVEEAINHIKDNIETERTNFSIFKEKYTKPYCGYIRNNMFEIKRNIEYRMNSFLPIITGVITTIENKTIINIKMKVAKLVAVFSIFMLSFALFLIISGIIIKSIGFTIISIFSFFWAYCLMHLLFNVERNKSKEYLLKLFEAIEINN